MEKRDFRSFLHEALLSLDHEPSRAICEAKYNRRESSAGNKGTGVKTPENKRILLYMIHNIIIN